MNIENFIGQERLKKKIQYLISFYGKQNKLLPHILLIGTHGLGKTTFAHLIFKEFIKFKKVDFVKAEPNDPLKLYLNFFNNYPNKSILFIDEIHTLKNIESLFKYMDDPNRKFTLIAATTKESKIDKPLLSRFAIVERFEDYTEEEVVLILKNKLKEYNLEIKEDEEYILRDIYKKCQGSIRVALNILDFLRIVKTEENKPFSQVYETSLNLLGIDNLGLNPTQRKYLSILKEYKEVTLNFLTNILNTTPQEIEEVIEPPLLKLKLINITSRGRIYIGGEYGMDINK